MLRRVPLRPRNPWRRPPKPVEDRMTEATRNEVLARDGGCIAPRLGAVTPCRDTWGNVIHYNELRLMEVDHIRLDPGGKRRSVPEQLVTGCPGHHRLDGWHTANRALIRIYLRKLYPEKAA